MTRPHFPFILGREKDLEQFTGAIATHLSGPLQTSCIARYHFNTFLRNPADTVRDWNHTSNTDYFVTNIINTGQTTQLIGPGGNQSPYQANCYNDDTVMAMPESVMLKILPKILSGIFLKILNIMLFTFPIMLVLQFPQHCT